MGTTSVLFNFNYPRFLLFFECCDFKWSMTNSYTSLGKSEILIFAELIAAFAYLAAAAPAKSLPYDEL